MMPKGQTDQWSSSRGRRLLTFSKRRRIMGNKLYVGGLPYSVTEGRLQEIFAEHGTVESAKVIIDKFTGQSRGFGFVEMASGGEAQRAIQALNGTQLDGRSLVVNEAKPMERRDGGGGDRGNRSGGRNRW
jgi:RNA recognition motif-containing protein